MPVLIAIAGLFLAAVTIILVAVIGNAANNDNNRIHYIPPDNPTQRIPGPLLTMYEEAGERSGIPWTVLAAIGEIATGHGDHSPYDSIDRNPFYGLPNGEVAFAGTSDGPQPPTEDDADTDTGIGPGHGNLDGSAQHGDNQEKPSFFPIVTPAIGTAGEPGHAFGPLLLWPDIANGNPQEWSNSLDVATREIVTIQRQLASEGILPPQILLQTPEAADEYWEQVLSRFRGGRSPVESSYTCSGITSDSTVAEAAASIMRCAAHQADAVVVTGLETTPLGTSATEITGAKAANVLADDLISVIYAADPTLRPDTLLSAHIAPGCENRPASAAKVSSSADGTSRDGNSRDGNSVRQEAGDVNSVTYRGIVPLTDNDMAELTIENPCDHVAVLTAVSEAVAERT
ncbi:MAG: hypothetical protein ACF8TS_12855, partial [Maioricimonas sp. JB049]